MADCHVEIPRPYVSGSPGPSARQPTRACRYLGLWSSLCSSRDPWSDLLKIHGVAVLLHAAPLNSLITTSLPWKQLRSACNK